MSDTLIHQAPMKEEKHKSQLPAIIDEVDLLILRIVKKQGPIKSEDIVAQVPLVRPNAVKHVLKLETMKLLEKQRDEQNKTIRWTTITQKGVWTLKGLS